MLSHLDAPPFTLRDPRLFEADYAIFLVWKLKISATTVALITDRRKRDKLISSGFLLFLGEIVFVHLSFIYIPYPKAFPYGKGMVLHFYQQQESSTTKTVHKVINKGLKAYVQSPHTGENFH